MKKFPLTLIIMVLVSTHLINAQQISNINSSIVSKVCKNLETKHGIRAKFRIEKGVKQIANLWQTKDGNTSDFETFCTEYFISDDAEIAKLFEKIQTNFEILYGHYNKISIDFKRPLHLEGYDLIAIDDLFGAFDPFSHVKDDFFENKIAFIIALNFPFYTLEEKEIAGDKWTAREWGYARAGDLFTSRVPANLSQNLSDKTTAADTYISNYNIYMGNVLDNTGKSPFPKDLILITHWGLRDELKTQYADKKNGLNNQKLIYTIMRRIILQTIPSEVINSDKYTWNPYSNKLFANATEIKVVSEPDTRYMHMISIFKAMKEIDAYSPNYPTYISRKFDEEMEMSQKEVEQMFINFVSSPQVLKVAKLIERRLERKLQPFDIWYDGFKSRSTVSQEELDKKVKEMYPNKDAFVKGLPVILSKLGFPNDKVNFICSKIEVDGSRGAGHAWGAMMKDDNAHLRSRIGNDGMNYKGYNIAVHEFGHNVEQTISLHFVDNYFMNGVPNTAFTEALAFIFQKRDLDLLGITSSNAQQKDLMALDIFWGCYEIMGVSLVDMYAWKWLYANPNATAEELKLEVNKIAIEVWNKYYTPVFGIKDEPILAVYSHMIDAPLYLSAYPIGHLVEFQLEKYLENKTIGTEVLRIFALGRLHPQLWMQKAVGETLSIQPLLNSVDAALKEVR